MKQILGYSDKLTVRPGDEIGFKISARTGTPYRAQLVRLINGDTHSKAAAFKEIEIASPIDGTYAAIEQPLMPGSCIVINEPRRPIAPDAFTASVFFMPTTPRLGRQHLLCRWDQTAHVGWSLHLDGQGRLAFTTVDDRGRASAVHTPHETVERQWYHAAARIDWASGTITLECTPCRAGPMHLVAPSCRETAELSGTRPTPSAPLMIAAGFGGYGPTGRCMPGDSFNGRIEAPAIYQGQLTDPELQAVMAGERPVALAARLLGDWDFSVGIDSTAITDRSAHEHHGETHNLPLRGVRGVRWSGVEMSWRQAPAEYGAIHFHTDDLYDCGWKTAIRYTIPADMRSGIYALRLRVKDQAARTVEEPHEEYLPFFVAAARGRPQSGLAFLVPTYTYLTYGNVRVEDLKRKDSGLSRDEYFATLWTGPGLADCCVVLSEHPELGSSTYDRHFDGSPVHTASWLRPVLNMRPKSVLWTFCADLLITDWLEAKEIPYDIITDDLLDAEGAALLNDYRVIMTGNHPEYHTTAQLNAIESYLGGGGRLVYLGGNGFYWRCASHGSLPGVVEVRRCRTGTSTWASEVGEEHFAFTGELGGIWRDLGRAPQRLVGVGFIAQGRDEGYFRILPEARQGRAAFVFKDVNGDVLGNFGIFGAAVGQEIDRTNRAYGTPPHAIVLARSENHSSSMMYVIEEMDAVNPLLASYLAQTYAEVVFFETPAGGAVFSVGSMTWCGSLIHNGYDNDVSTMTVNAVKRMLDPARFDVPQVNA
jgi:N,N-dimethylformamidase